MTADWGQGQDAEGDDHPPKLSGDGDTRVVNYCGWCRACDRPVPRSLTFKCVREVRHVSVRCRECGKPTPAPRNMTAANARKQLREQGPASPTVVKSRIVTGGGTQNGG